MKITRTLKVGVSGNDVKFLQESLNSIGNYGLNVTGTFDSSTESVVKAFQNKHHGLRTIILWVFLKYLRAFSPSNRHVLQAEQYLRRESMSSSTSPWYLPRLLFNFRQMN